MSRDSLADGKKDLRSSAIRNEMRDCGSFFHF